ncbi:MAG: hypothetical protein ABSB58_01645 [Gemmatimonadales bacterium]|jgi:hypothetical protein
MTLLRSGAFRRALLCVGLPAALGACALTFDTRSLGVPVTMASPVAAPAVGDTFTVTQTAVHLLWGVYEARRVNLQSALANQLGEGHGIANLRIRTRHRLGDVILTVLTGGLIAPTTVTFEGIITHAAR